MNLNVFRNAIEQEDRVSFYSKLLSQVPDLIFQMTISEDGTIKFPFLSESVVNHFELTADEIGNYSIDLVKSKIIRDDFPNFFDSIEKSKRDRKSVV